MALVLLHHLMLFQTLCDMDDFIFSVLRVRRWRLRDELDSVDVVESGFGIQPVGLPRLGSLHSPPPWISQSPCPPELLALHFSTITFWTWGGLPRRQLRNNMKGKWLFKRCAVGWLLFLILRNVSRWFVIHRKMLIWVRNLFRAINISRMVEESSQTANVITS